MHAFKSTSRALKAMSPGQMFVGPRIDCSLMVCNTAHGEKFMGSGVPDLIPNSFNVTNLGFTPVCGFGGCFQTNLSISTRCSRDTGVGSCGLRKDCSNSLGFRHPPFHRRFTIKLSLHTRLMVPVFSVGTKLKQGLMYRKSSARKFCRVLTLGACIAHRLFLRIKCRLDGFGSPGGLVLKLKCQFRSGE